MMPTPPPPPVCLRDPRLHLNSQLGPLLGLTCGGHIRWGHLQHLTWADPPPPFTSISTLEHHYRRSLAEGSSQLSPLSGCLPPTVLCLTMLSDHNLGLASFLSKCPLIMINKKDTEKYTSIFSKTDFIKDWKPVGVFELCFVDCLFNWTQKILLAENYPAQVLDLIKKTKLAISGDNPSSPHRKEEERDLPGAGPLSGTGRKTERWVSFLINWWKLKLNSSKTPPAVENNWISWAECLIAVSVGL